ncbi:fibrobacter succinogenes major paralogous domain-containing protein [Bacteroidales bacterium OttesenSCG-928-B11]|nr:fibrobacter succinogenes major paralogous domain-containing protein [Bacteroidales bacterium OttesenSCG-928-B11]
MLYDYNTATRGGTDVFGIRGVCPDGWYIPTPEQYRNLFSVGVNQLKATTDWLDVINSTNSSGFSALPAGYFNWAAQTSQHLLGDAYFWTSQNDNDGNATIAHIHFGCNDLLMEQMRVQNGLSVRCVKIDPSHCNMPPSITNIPNTINLGCEDETFNININANDKIGQNAYLQITLSPAVIADSIIFQHQISGSMVDITFVNGVALIDESSMATTGLEDMTASFHIQLADNTVNTQTATINWAIVNSTNTTEVWSSMKTSLLELQPPIEPTMNIVFEGTKPYQIGCDSLPFKAIITVGTCIGEAGYTFEYVGEQNVGDVYYSLNNSDWRKVGENDEGGLTITQDTTIYFYLDNQYMPGEEIDTSIYLYFRLYDGDITIVDTTYANEPDADPTFEVTTAFAIMTMTDVKGNLIEFEENIPLTLDYAPDTLYVAIAPSVCSKGEGLIKIQGHADVAPYISLEYFERFGGANVWRLIEFKEDGSAWFDGGATGGFDIEPISVMLRIRQKQCTNNSELTNDGLPFTFTMVATDSTTVVSNTITQNVFCNRVPDCITIENNITGSICGAANFEVNINFGESGGPSVFPVAGGVKGEVTITLAEPTYKDSISLSFHNRAGGNDQWDMLTFDENGVAVFDGGMSGGFPLGSDQNYPVNFKITTAANLADHKLPYTLRLVDASNRNVIYATAKDTVTLRTGGAKIAFGEIEPDVLEQTLDSSFFHLTVTPIGCMEDTAAYVMVKFGAPSSIALAFDNKISGSWENIVFDSDSLYKFSGGVTNGFPLNGDIMVGFTALSRAMNDMNDVPYEMWVIAASDSRVLSDTLKGTIDLKKNMFGAKTTLKGYYLPRNVLVPPTEAIDHLDFIAKLDSAEFKSTTNASLKIKITEGSKNDFILRVFNKTSSRWEIVEFDHDSVFVNAGLAAGIPVLDSLYLSLISKVNANTDINLQFDLVEFAKTDSEMSRYSKELPLTLKALDRECADCFTGAGVIETGKDGNGETYKARLMPDGKYWMIENLRTTKFPGGKDIPNLYIDAFTENYTAAYSLPSDLTANGIPVSPYKDINYGAYYNWAAAAGISAAENLADPYFNDYDLGADGTRQGICPEGWRLPSSKEYDMLVDSVKKASGSTTAYSLSLICPEGDWNQSGTAKALMTLIENNPALVNKYCMSITSTANLQAPRGRGTQLWSSTRRFEYDGNLTQPKNSVVFMLPGEDGAGTVTKGTSARYNGGVVRCMREPIGAKTTLKNYYPPRDVLSILEDAVDHLDFIVKLDTVDFKPAMNASLKIKITEGSKNDFILRVFNNTTSRWEIVEFDHDSVFVNAGLAAGIPVLDSLYLSLISKVNANTDINLQFDLVEFAKTDSEMSRYSKELPLTLKALDRECADCFTGAGVIETGKDGNGETYKARLMPDGKYWMIENLRTTKFPGGKDIPNLYIDAFTENYTAAYSLPSDLTANGIPVSPYKDINYGAYYNWAAAAGISAAENLADPYFNDYDLGADGTRQGICPEGWRLPSSKEYDMLVDSVKKASGSTTAYSLSLICPEGDWNQSGTAKALMTLIENNPALVNKYCMSITSTANLQAPRGRGTQLWSSTRRFEYDGNLTQPKNSVVFMLPGEDGAGTVTKGTSARYNGGVVRCIKDVTPAVVDSIKYEATNANNHTFVFYTSGLENQIVKVEMTAQDLSTTRESDGTFSNFVANGKNANPVLNPDISSTGTSFYINTNGDDSGIQLAADGKLTLNFVSHFTSNSEYSYTFRIFDTEGNEITITKGGSGTF